jgi:hypothetical protein
MLFRLTPLTTFGVRAEGTADRFTFDRVRNADSVKLMSGFDLKPFALISGSAYVGVRRFNGLDERVPDYQGVVAAVDALYTVGVTRLILKVNRDLAYSYEPNEPYYGLTDVSLDVTERITQAWDIVGRGGMQWLDYRGLASTTDSRTRVDRARVYGAGIGYRIGETLRVGLDANYYHRTSPVVTLRDYDGLRFGASFSYGLPR